MRVRVGTFNLNNLFSRFNFSAEVGAIGDIGVKTTTTFRFEDPTSFRLRTYQGRLVKGKPPTERARVAERIGQLDVDVLAVQEVEDVDTLHRFAQDELAELGYRFAVLVEGNDPRLIDVGVLSRLPIGGVTSWRHAVHPGGTEPVFSRDLVEVDILDAKREKRLFTLFNTHLKSHYVPFGEDQQAGAAAADERRRQQAAAIARIVTLRTRPNSRYLVVGDMNDPPESEFLGPMRDGLPLVDGLAEATEDRPAPADDPPAPSRPWTHRFKESGVPAHYELLDHVWISAGLSAKQTGAGIGRRRRLTRDGSDHDPAWVELTL